MHSQASSRQLTKLATLSLSILFSAVLPSSASAGIISYEVNQLGSTLSGTTAYRISYTLQDLSFMVNQELDIRFDPAIYLTLSNPVVPAGFDVLVIQPNNPPGAYGDFSAMALFDRPAVSGVFSVDVISTGRPGSQPFQINQLTVDGRLQLKLDSGATLDAAAVPEPVTLSLVGLALVAGGLAARTRARR
jgi:hypothetical protein